MRARLGVLAAVLVAATLSPADAAPVPLLRLSGRATGYVDLTLTRPTTFGEARARLTTRGTYVGWWIARIGEPVTSSSNQAGGVRVVDPAAPASPYADHGFGFREAPLDPGRYRLYLATDGPSTVEVAAEGLPRSLSLTPTRRTTSMATRATMPVLPGGFAYGVMREPTAVPPHTLAASSVVAYSSPGLTAEGLAACVVRPGGACDDPGQPGAAWGYVMSLYDDFSVGVTAIYEPGSLGTGAYEGRQSVTAGPGVTRVVGSLFQLVTVP